ncbi:hypothetical protein HYH02_009069 [Chlamydomonas schloesseri]|uniref:Peptidase M11 gametolysin domain-containing protein n=1 Tax=Chlamydomonas schloesseri TaxID=2026947 RepID=A0A836B103_9CHLO|nr:hypothetical protein HYH02_009069 [Chlamydomonas schloesseri]|eukprot:KAG2444129.1 hypothetical protein HYH02_009069 [Chlamydomonas schloesseri]
MALGSDAASRGKSRSPPMMKRPPPRRTPAPQAAPSSPPQEVVTVIVNVTGQLAQSLNHASGVKDVSSEESTWDLVANAELVNRLVPVAPQSMEEAAVNTRVDLTSEDTLVTGDHVDAPLALDVPKSLAEQLGLDVDSGGGPKDADASGSTDGSSTGTGGNRRLRRRLTADQHRARRMILDFHGTRRTLAEFNDLTTVLSQLGIQNQEPRAHVTGKAKKNGGAKDLMIIGGKPLNISSATFFFTSSSCGINPVLTEAQLRARWYDSGNSSSVTATLQRAYQVCSYNKLGFYPDSNMVIGPVDVPCTGTTTLKGPYDLKNGMGNKKNLDAEMYGMYELAKDWLKKNGRTDVLARLPYLRRKILVWPWNNVAQTMKNGMKPLVDWPGMGSMGCPGNPDPNGIAPDCFAWMNNDLSSTNLDLQVLFQELGHNIGMTHSARYICDAKGCSVDEYGDPTCPMGGAGPVSYEKSFTCLAAPQAYKAGWASPLVNLNKNTIAAGSGWTDYTVPSMHSTDTNFIRVAIDQTGINSADRLKPERALYISYRVAQPLGAYDSGLPKELNARVWIHEYNETANGVSADPKKWPVLFNMLDLPVMDPKTKKVGPPIVPGWVVLPKAVFPSAFGAGDSLTVWLKSKTNTSATVSLCRATDANETEETCYNGLDDDCDGLPDDVDPDCGGEDPNTLSPPPPPLAVMRKSPPPSPPPSPAPVKPPPPAKRATGRRLA